MTVIKIKDCPFCQSSNVETYLNHDYCYVRCCDCNAQGSSIELDPESERYELGDSDIEERQAIIGWNKRT